MSDDDDKRTSHKTFRGFATPGVDQPAVAPPTSVPPGSLPDAIGDGADTEVDRPITAPTLIQAAAPKPPTPVAPTPVAPASAAPQETMLPMGQGAFARTPLVEIEVLHQHGSAPRTEPPYPTLEVWTQNRVYVMDPAQICIDVVNRHDNKKAADHPFLAQRLVGGQHRDGERIELSYPFPRPGTEAVFERVGGRPGNFSRTSTVQRVVLRLHVVTVAPATVVPTWAEITGAHPEARS